MGYFEDPTIKIFHFRLVLTKNYSLRVIICKDQVDGDSGVLKNLHIPIFYSSYGYNNSHKFFWLMVKYFWVHSYMKLKKSRFFTISIVARVASNLFLDPYTMPGNNI